jgi:hypothetical protein
LNQETFLESNIQQKWYEIQPFISCINEKKEALKRKKKSLIRKEEM